MRKLSNTAVTLILLLTLIPSFGQNRIGIINGLHFTNVAEESKQFNFSSRTSFGIGLILEIPVGRRVSLQLEPMLLQKGGVTTLQIIEGFNIGADFILKSSFIEIPVFLKSEFGIDVKPYIIAGPVFSFLLSSDIVAEFAGLSLKQDVKNSTKGFDLGLGFGGGLSIPFKRFNFVIEGSYTLGLSKMYNGNIMAGPVLPDMDELDLEYPDIQYKNRGLKLMIGLTYPFGR
ncbi:porin family protein [candidate division KSB1 bacterium]